MSAPYLLVYDIPTNPETGLPIMANPSGLLRRYAFRVNLSCWVIQADDLNSYEIMRLFQRFLNYKVEFHTVKFDVTEGQKLLDMAVKSLRQQIQEYVDNGIRTMGRANTELGTDTDTPTDAIKRHKAKCVTVAKRIGALMKDMKECAKRFGVPEEQLRLGDTIAAVRGIANTMVMRVHTFFSSLAMLERYAGSADPMVKAARAGQAPMWAVADYMEDTGKKRMVRQAKQLRSMWS